MHKVEINAVQVRDRRPWRNGSIERVTCLQHHRVAWVNAHDRWNIRMPAIVPCAGLLAETFAPINMDCMDSHSNVLSSGSSLERAYTQPQQVSTHDARGRLSYKAGAEQLSTPAARAD